MQTPSVSALALGLVPLVLLLLPRASTAHAGCPQDSSCRAPSRAEALSLVQVRQELDKAHSELHRRASGNAALDKTSSAKRAAAEIRSYLSAPSNVSTALAAGLTAVHRALSLFVTVPPQVSKGLVQMGSELLDAVVLMVPDDLRQTEEFAALRGAWNEAVISLPAVMGSTSAGIDAYREEGDASALLAALATAVRELGVLTTQSLPEILGAEVAKYLGAVEDALEGFDGALEAFAAGNTVSAVQTVYSGIRLATAELLPAEVTGEESFNAVVGALDVVFRDLSDTVLRYQQQLLQSSVCWKDFMRRERVRPSQCPPRHYWDGEHWCFSEREAGDSAGAALLDTSAVRKRPSGALPPRCVDGSDFREKRGAWCYKECPAGTEASGTRCKSACMGLYPIASPLMCGKSPGTVAAAIRQMLVRAVTSGLTVAGVVRESGWAGSLQGTITSLVNVSMTFVHPKCPTLGVTGK